MTGLRLAIFILAVLSLGSAASAQSRNPEDYTYMCEDLPPANYLEGGELRGASVELLKLLWRRMGTPEQPIKVLPWARGYELVKTEGDRVLFSMSRSREREGLFKWVGPIFTVTHELVGLAERKLPIRSLEDAKAFQIGTIKNDITEIFLREVGFPSSSIQAVGVLAQNFKKLDEGRIDLIALSRDSRREYLRMRGLDPAIYRSYALLSSNANYYAFSRDSPDELIGRFMRALRSTEGERAAILDSYGMER